MSDIELMKPFRFQMWIEVLAEIWRINILLKDWNIKFVNSNSFDMYLSVKVKYE